MRLESFEFVESIDISPIGKGMLNWCKCVDKNYKILNWCRSKIFKKYDVWFRAAIACIDLAITHDNVNLVAVEQGPVLMILVKIETWTVK